MTDTYTDGYTPEQVLPHMAPMILIDKIVSWDEDHINTTAGSIRGELFIQDNGTTSSVICMEYLCQSAAAHAGIRQLEQGRPVTIGFIIGSRRMEIDDAAYRRGTLFSIEVEQTLRDDEGIGVYECALYHADRQTHGQQRIAYAQIKAMMPDNPHEIIHRTKTAN